MAWQPPCFTEAIECFLMHADSFSIMHFPGVELFLFSLLLCRKPKKSTQAEVPGYALNPKTFTAPTEAALAAGIKC